MDSSTATRPVIVLFPPALRARTGNHTAATVAGGSVREIIAALDQTFPGLRFNLCYETGELRSFVNIFVNGQNIRYLRVLDTPVPEGATLHILHSVAGG